MKVDIDPKYTVILGSSSKFRREIMMKQGLQHICMKPDIDEKSVSIPGYDGVDRSRAPPQLLTLAIARAKASALMAQVAYPALLITSDQVVAYQGTIREKPDNVEECLDYLMSYNQDPACTVSGLVVTNTLTKKQVCGVDVAKQYFKGITREKLRPIVEANGDFLCSCGGFIVEDPNLWPYLDHREGTEESVRGLPMELLLRLLQEAQIEDTMK